MTKIIKIQNPNFDKKLYWERRKKGLRGQSPTTNERQEG